MGEGKPEELVAPVTVPLDVVTRRTAIAASAVQRHAGDRPVAALPNRGGTPAVEAAAMAVAGGEIETWRRLKRAAITNSADRQCKCG